MNFNIFRLEIHCPQQTPVMKHHKPISFNFELKKKPKHKYVSNQDFYYLGENAEDHQSDTKPPQLKEHKT